MYLIFHCRHYYHLSYVPLLTDCSSSQPYLHHPSASIQTLPANTYVKFQVEKFVDEECIPADAVFAQQLGTTTAERFSAHPPIIEELKLKAKKLGLWNMFLPKAHFKEGAGFSNLEYGLMAELLGKSATASEVRRFPKKDW